MSNNKDDQERRIIQKKTQQDNESLYQQGLKNISAKNLGQQTQSNKSDDDNKEKNQPLTARQKMRNDAQPQKDQRQTIDLAFRP